VAAKEGRIDPHSITPELLGNHLATQDIPDPDLLIRTSGEQRLSNYLLWQCAYTEFVFVDEYWPDFNRDTMQRAIAEYLTRERRYGGLTAQSA
jgi:undecaprenyl diphosphate synthase